MFKKNIWEIIPNLKINWKPAPYWVINERAVRKNALIIFSLGILTFIYTIITRDFLFFNILVPILFIDFWIKVFVWPKYSPFSKLANFLVKDQKKEYVWAKQKRFAWGIWFVMSFITLTLVIWFWITCGLSMFLCMLCLIFMFAEAFFWYCVGCSIYIYLRNNWYIKIEKHAPVCANWKCELK